jgi:hypothetical protein
MGSHCALECPSQRVVGCPQGLAIVGLCLPVLAHSWHNGGLVVRRAVAFAWRTRLFAARPHATVVTTGSASTTSSTTAASRANLVVGCTVRQRVGQMCTLEIDEAYSTKYQRFRSSLTYISYCTF